MNPTVVMPEMTVVWPDIETEVVWPNRKRICIDLDGVVCEYDFPKIVKEHFGVKIKGQEIYAYDLPDVLGVSQEDINTMFQEQVQGRPQFIRGSVETLFMWKCKGYKLTIFSNRTKYMGYDGLMKWLRYWHIPFTDIDGGKDEYDVHIDDSPAKLMLTNSKTKLLFTQPWNKRCLNITGQLIRVKNWQEVRENV